MNNNTFPINETLGQENVSSLPPRVADYLRVWEEARQKELNRKKGLEDTNAQLTDMLQGLLDQHGVDDPVDIWVGHSGYVGSHAERVNRRITPPVPFKMSPESDVVYNLHCREIKTYHPGYGIMTDGYILEFQAPDSQDSYPVLVTNSAVVDEDGQLEYICAHGYGNEDVTPEALPLFQELIDHIDQSLSKAE